MAEFARDFAKQWVPVGAGAAFQRVRRNVESMNVLGNWIRILQNPGVFAQKLQVLGSFLQEDFDEFCSGRAHKLSCKVLTDLR